MIAVDGKPVARAVDFLYLLLNKPAGVVTTRHDPHAPRTVMDLVRPALEERLGKDHPAVGGLHPVGRLDADTEGLLLLTNDGALTHALTHPSRGVDKVYEARVQGLPSEEALTVLRRGVEVDGRPTAAARVRRLGHDPERREARVEVKIHEGRKRQVRRMLAAVGHRVLHLRRTRFGPLSLGRLPSGQWRELTPAEVQALRVAAGLQTACGRLGVWECGRE